MSAFAPTPAPPSPGRYTAPDWLIVALLFVAAAALRAWGVNWSLPYVMHPDEPQIIDAAVRMIKSGQPNPGWYLYPALVIYFQTAIAQLNLWWGTAQGYYVGPASLPDRNYVFTLAPEVFLWGRVATALVGAATVAALYAVGRAMIGRAAGLVAALLLLTAPVHVEQAHYLVTDTAMGAVGLAVLVAAWRLAWQPGARLAAGAGLLVGICAGAKYNGAYSAILPACAWLFGLHGRGVPGATQHNVRWVAAGVGMAAAAVLGFVLTNPYALLDWPHWSKGFLFEVNDYRPVASLAGALVPLQAYADALWSNERAIVLPALAGAVLLLIEVARSRDPRLLRLAAVLLPFPVLFILLMCRFERTYERNLIIILAPLCLLAGYAVARLATWLRDRMLALRAAQSVPSLQVALRQPRAAIALAGLIGLGLTAEPGRQMINFSSYLASPDSRLAAYAWLQTELRAGRRAAVELHPLLTCAPAPWACPTPDLYAPLTPLTRQPPQWYAAHGYDYALLIGDETALLEDPTVSGPRPPADLAPYHALPVVRRFAGDGEGGKGPPVWIVRVGAGRDAIPGVTHSGARFGDLVALWGYALTPLAAPGDLFDPAQLAPAPDARFRRGAALGLNLYWQAVRDGAGLHGTWTVAVHLTDAAGAIAAQVDVVPISAGRQRPAQAWYNGEFLAGSYNLALPATLAPGPYRLTVALYDAPAGGALPVQGPGLPATDHLDLGTIQVGP